MFAILLAFAVLSLIGISGSLRTICEHNLKFLPPDVEGVREGDIVIVDASGVELPYHVGAAVRLPDGSLALKVTPISVQ